MLSDIGIVCDIKDVSGQEFREALIKARNCYCEEERWRVVVLTAEEYGSACAFRFVTEGGSCVAITRNGRIISLCRHKEDAIRGWMLLYLAVKHGATSCYAFGERLYKFYTRHGFVPFMRAKWVSERAPDGFVPPKKNSNERESLVFFGIGRNFIFPYEVYEKLEPPAAQSLVDFHIYGKQKKPYES